MNAYVPDANALAKQHERREHEALGDNTTTHAIPPPRGTLHIWRHVGDMTGGYDAALTFEDVTPPDLTKPGVIIVYDEGMDAKVFFPAPNAYAEFVLNREGE